MVLSKLLALVISDSGFVLDPLTGATFSLNRTGLCLLRAMRDGQRNPSALAAVLEEAFELPDSADPERDLREFLLALQHSECRGGPRARLLEDLSA